MTDVLATTAISWGFSAASWLISPVLIRLLNKCFNALGIDPQFQSRQQILLDNLVKLETMLLPKLLILADGRIGSEAHDQLQWNLTTSKTYTAGSFYNIISTLGRTIEGLPFTWQLKIPPSVKVFAYLCIQDRLLTQDVLIRRGIQCNRHCVQCQHCSLETAQHLLFQCQYAVSFWNRFRVHLGYNILHRGDSVKQTVIRSYKRSRHLLPRKSWGVWFFSACWCLWKERNCKVFDDKSMPPSLLAERAYKEARLWFQYC